MKEISRFKKQKKYLLCVDSDGCVMDTMNIKHSLCFGPCVIGEWELYPWKEEILNRWKEVNLYNITRGINRFKGLALILMDTNNKYKPISGVESFVSWTQNAPILSEVALQAIVDQGQEKKIFSKALSWSRRVNEAIDNLKPQDKLPFPGSKEALEFAHTEADVALVSSANQEAIIEEWSTHGLLDYVDVVMSQSDGSKSDCIEKLTKKGYDKKHVIMCGDAVGDFDAAVANKIFFYPIIVRREIDSWKDFVAEGFPRFISGSYFEYGEEKIRQFYNNLNK